MPFSIQSYGPVVAEDHEVTGDRIANRHNLERASEGRMPVKTPLVVKNIVLPAVADDDLHGRHTTDLPNGVALAVVSSPQHWSKLTAGICNGVLLRPD
ncbi:MAG: hypothetical protein R3E66_19815 [bacterium]